MSGHIGIRNPTWGVRISTKGKACLDPGWNLTLGERFSFLSYMEWLMIDYFFLILANFTDIKSV